MNRMPLLFNLPWKRVQAVCKLIGFRSAHMKNLAGMDKFSIRRVDNFGNA